MAIYKPSNCKPFLGAVDLTQDVNIQCEINTSNVPITGYKITVLDSNNDLVFEGEDYSELLPTINGDGLNGSLFTAPLVVVSPIEPNLGTLTTTSGSYNTTRRNYIWYNSTSKTWNKWDSKATPSAAWVELKTKEGEKNFYNNYTNQPYKWKVTFAQGQIWGPHDFSSSDKLKGGEVRNPTSRRDVDILITSGKTLGSTPKRIQTYLSDEIYKDYYVQLMDDNGNVAPRARISSYDRTFGYIYPQEGQISEADFNKATSIAIYQDANNADVVQAARTVNFALLSAVNKLNWGALFFPGATVPDAFKVGELKSATNKYYAECRVDGITRGQYKAFNDTAFTTGQIGFVSNGANYTVTRNGTTFLFMGEAGGAKTEDSYGTYSPLNGVWTFKGAADFTPSEAGSKAEDSQAGYCVLQFQRPSGANTWANYIGRNWFVTSGFMSATNDIPADDAKYKAGVNVSSNAKEGAEGVIDQSQLAFFPEKPIEIYPNSKDVYGNDTTSTTQGKIFKNTTGTEGKLYLKPFEGLDNSMRLYKDGSLMSDSGMAIAGLDKNYYSVNNALNITAEGVGYKVFSYFKSSDENAFYAYGTPQFEIKANPSFNTVDGQLILGNRYLTVEGIWDANNQLNWRNYKWTLTDFDTNWTEETDTIYYGNIGHQFEGLLDGHKYFLTLTIEDEMGEILTETRAFKVVLNDEELQSANFPLSIEFDCDTQSVDINFIRDGIIMPDIQSSLLNPVVSYVEVVNGVEGYMIIPDDVTMHYEETAYLVEGKKPENNKLVRGNPLDGPLTNSFTVTSEHSKLSPFYEGEIYEICVNSDETAPVPTRMKICVYLPAEIIQDKENPERKIPNSRRNQIFCRYWTEKILDGSEDNWVITKGSEDEAPVTIYLGDTMRENGYWRLSPETQDSVLVFSKNKLDYTPVKGYDYLNTTKSYNVTAYNRQGEIVYSPDSDKTLDNLQDWLYNDGEGIMRFPVEERANVSYRDQPFLVQPNQADYQVKEANEKTGVAKDPADYEDFIVQDQDGLCNVWSDNVLYLGKVLNKTEVIASYNVADSTKVRKWFSDTPEGIAAERRTFWNDRDPGNTLLYPQVDVNEVEEGVNHSGRQEINSKVLTFNIGVKNFDPTKTSFADVLNIVRQCFLKEQ